MPSIFLLSDTITSVSLRLRCFQETSSLKSKQSSRSSYRSYFVYQQTMISPILRDPDAAKKRILDPTYKRIKSQTTLCNKDRNIT